MKNARTIIFLIILIALLGLVGYVAYSLFIPEGSRTPDVDERPLFPFLDNLTGNRDVETTDETEEEIDDEEDEQEIVEVVEADRPAVFKVTDRPVTAYNIFSQPEVVTITRVGENGEPVEEEVEIIETITRFADTTDGAVYEVNLLDESLTEEQLTEPTVRRSREGLIGGVNGNHILLRYVNEDTETIETFLGTWTPQPELPERVCTVAITEDLRRGSRGVEVEQLQTLLGVTQNTTVVVDGVFGGGTEALLQAYQRSNDLEATGVTDQATRSTIDSTCLALELQIQGNEDEPRPVEGVFLRENIRTITLSPDNTRLFYLIKGDSGGEGFVLNLDTRVEQRVFGSPLSEWNSFWSTTNGVVLQSAASLFATGVVFELNSVTRELSRLYGDNTRGLTTLLSPDGGRLLISGTTATGLNPLRLQNTVDRTSQNLGITTIPEKCVWSSDNITLYCAVPENFPRGEYPDDWYKGRINFRDGVWAINALTGATQQIAGSAAFGEAVDGVELRISENDDFLLLRDRDSYTLWGIDLSRRI